MKKLLITAYWIGIIADAVATVLLFSPTVADIVLQPLPFEMHPLYLYVSRVAGALMLGWTALLFWAQRKPIERADILLITLFPVVTALTAAAVFVVKSGQISMLSTMPIFVLYVVAYCTFIPSYMWAKRQTGMNLLPSLRVFMTTSFMEKPALRFLYLGSLYIGNSREKRIDKYHSHKYTYR